MVWMEGSGHNLNCTRKPNKKRNFRSKLLFGSSSLGFPVLSPTLHIASLANHVQNDAQDDRTRPNVHGGLELQFFFFDMLPTPNVGVEHANQAQDPLQHTLA